MKKQKICVIGDGLSGLAATLILSQLDVKIDFISKNDQKKKKLMIEEQPRFHRVITIFCRNV